MRQRRAVASTNEARPLRRGVRNGERERGRVVAVVEYRDGTIIDVVRQVEGGGVSTSADTPSDTDMRLSSA